MNYKQIQWSNIVTIVPAWELSGMTFCYLAKIEISITPDTLSGYYADRSNQLKLELEPGYPKDATVNDNDGQVLNASEYLFKCVSSSKNSYDLLLLVNSYGNNIGYIILNEPQNIWLAKKFYIKLTLVVTEKIVEAIVDSSVGQIETYSPIQTEKEFKWKYRGVTEQLIKDSTIVKLQNLLGGFGEYNSQGILSLFDFPRKIELPEFTTRTINLLRLITIEGITYVYEVYTVNGNKGVCRYMFNESSPNVEILLDPTSLGDFVVPYINACLVTTGSTTKVVYYKEFGSITKSDNGFGFRIYNDHVYLNYNVQLISMDEEGILNSVFNEWEFYNLFYVSVDLIIYALRNSPNSILTQRNSFENNSIIKYGLTGIPKYSLIERVGLYDFVIKGNNLFKLLRIAHDAHQDISSTDFLNENRLGTLDFSGEDLTTNSNKVRNIIPYKGVYYYLKSVDNKNYLYLV